MSKAVRNVYSLKNEKLDKISIIILAAAIPLRMTSFVSKLFAPVNNDTVLNKYLQAFKKNISNYEIIVVGGYAIDDLWEKLPQDIVLVENLNYNTTNNAKSLKLGLMAATTNNILVMYDSLLLDEKLFAGVDFTKSFIISESDNNAFAKEQIGVIKNNQVLEHLSYDIKEKWANIVYFSNNESVILKKLVKNITDKSITFELINDCISNNGKFNVYNHSGKVKNIYNSKSLK